MIAVVGGGITGLALGRELAARGADFVVLEAAAEPGGVMRSLRVEGRVLDLGPQRTRLTPTVAELVDALGLGERLLTAPPGLPLFVYRDGRLRKVPFSVGEYLRTDLLGPLAKLRPLLEPLTAAPRPHETVAGLLRRKLGGELYEHLAGPLYGGLYASDPADMVVGLSLGHVLRELGVGRSLVLPLLRRGGRVRPPAACSFAGGMQELPLAMAASLGDRLRLDTPVRSLARRDGGWEVGLDAGALAAAVVVLTVSAPVASRLLEPVAPGAAGRIGGLRYNPLGVVHLLAEPGLHGLGFQVSLAEDLALRGVTFNDSLFGRAGVHTAYLGGARRPEVVELDDDALGALAVAELRRCTGRDSRPLAVAREAMPAWDRSWAALAGLELPPGLHLAANWESRPGIPGRLVRARRLAGELTGAP